MFHRSLTRSLRQTSPFSSQATCTLCKCSCGRKFRPDGPRTTVQKRFYEPRRDLQNPYAIEAQRKKDKEEYERREERRYYDGLVMMKAEGHLNCTVDNALEFLNAFAQLRVHIRGLKAGALGVEEQALQKLMAAYQIASVDVLRISFMLLNDFRVDYKALGKKMIYKLASIGDWQAIVHIVSQALAAAKTNPDILKKSELTPVRKQLHAIASNSSFGTYHNVSLVLHGKMLDASGDVDGAIECWERSLPGLVAYSEEQIDKGGQPYATDALNTALETPWIELTNAYLAQKQFANAKWAAGIGCAQDDPISHYLMSLLESTKNEHGEHVATSTWLYHITKAAGAGHVKAAHTLGNWYGSSGWKYIEDEPPDEIKPTPFDSYPPDRTSESSVWDQVSTAIGIKSQSNNDLQHQLFLTAAFPDTALGRINIAIKWLEVSMAVMYAPSYLLAAKLLLEKTLWPVANAPKTALDLEDDRYAYASKADYQAGVPIAKASDNATHEEEEIPNASYDPERAKDLVREVFYAVQALEYRKRHMIKIRRNNKGKDNDFDEDLEFSEGRLTSWPADIRKWFRYPESREMYADDQRGVLWDDELNLDLKVEARKICEEQGWDIYDKEGGLMYRHGMQMSR